MSTLRHVAVYVDEPEAGAFKWVLIERHGRSWRELATAQSPVERYQRAMADGLVALQALVPDLDNGPRDGDTATDDVPEDHAGAEKKTNTQRKKVKAAKSATAGSDTAQGDEAKRERAKREPTHANQYFGFGPVR